jgi:hypothetical protein
MQALPPVRRKRRVRIKFHQKTCALVYAFGAECRGMAAEVQQPELRAHFIRVANVWNDLADPVAERGPRILPRVTVIS